MNKSEEFLELLKTTKLDPSFDDNTSIEWASSGGHIEIVRHLLNDLRVDPSTGNNYPIRQARNLEIARLLFNDGRVRSKLTDEEHKEISEFLRARNKLLN